jgi:parallel beta-helix repeat protein
MPKLTKRLIILVLTLSLALGSMTAFGVVYDAYKLALGEPRWQTKYNNFVDATASLGNLIVNWVGTVDSLTLISTAPTYSDASTFTLAGNFSALLTPGKRLVADCKADGLLPNTVVSCTYAAPNSTVVVTTANLTANLAAVSYYATRNGVNTYGSGDIVASEFGAPSWGTFQAVVALANSTGRRALFTPGTWPVTDNLTITAPWHPVPGAILEVATTKTLALNGPGPADTGLYRFISLIGTGKVTFGAGAVSRLHPEWWGTDYAALQAAATAAAAKTLAITADYTITSALTIPADTTVEATVPLPSISTSSNILVGSGVKLHGLALTFTGAATSGVYGTSLTSLEIEKCVLVGTVAQQMMVRVESSSNVRILNNDLSGGADLLYIYKTSKVNIEGNFLHDNTDAGSYENGIHLVTDVSTAMSGVVIKGNQLKDLARHGITMWSGDCAVYDNADQDGKRQLTNVTIVGNTLDTCAGAGIWGSLLEGITVTGNTLRNITAEGIDFEGSRNCVAHGNTLYNAGPNYGSLTTFFGSHDIVFSNNSVMMENDEFAIGGSGVNAKTTSFFAYIRDDCSRVKLIGNSFNSKTAGSFCGEINIFKGSITATETAAGTNHHTRAALDVVIENNTFTNGNIRAVDLVDNLLVQGNKFVDEVDIRNSIYGYGCTDISVINNEIRCVPGSALTGSWRYSPILISSEGDGAQRVTRAVIEGNRIYGYPTIGISVQTYIGGTNGSYAIRNNKVAAIFYNTTSAYRLMELNHDPDTYAVITPTSF